jgi:hypothetical protein
LRASRWRRTIGPTRDGLAGDLPEDVLAAERLQRNVQNDFVPRRGGAVSHLNHLRVLGIESIQGSALEAFATREDRAGGAIIPDILVQIQNRFAAWDTLRVDDLITAMS